MSDIVSIQAPTGITLTANIRDLDGLVYDGDSFVAYVGDDADDYALAMDGDEAGVYTLSFPAEIPAGSYTVYCYTDGIGLGGGTVMWDGTDLINLSDVEASLASLSSKLTSQRITCVMPQIDGTVLTLIRGDDYDGDRSLVWTTQSEVHWVEITGASVKFTLQKNPAVLVSGAASLETTGTVVTPTGTHKSVSVSLSAEETASLAPGTSAYFYRLWATLSGGSVVTLSTGTLSAISPAAHVEEED